MWNKFGQWVECLFEDHKLVRRLLVIWAVWLITTVVLDAMNKVAVIDAPAATMITGIIGILATVTAFYIRSRELDGKRNDVD